MTRLDKDHIGIEDKIIYLLGGVTISLNIPIEQLQYMFGRRVIFDMAPWLKDTSPVTPYAMQEFPVLVFTLELGRWLMQVQTRGLCILIIKWRR